MVTAPLVKPALRGIDHLVLPVRDLAAARAFYARLGFQLTPVARHPWGTENSLVQFDGAFLELLAVADARAIEEPGPGRFSFGAFNRDFLRRREGCSMLVLDSLDESADRSAFEAAGLAVFEPFHFARKATRPDGSIREVAFSLTFTGDPALPGIGFFTCRQHVPENFWTPAYQRHSNGAVGIDAVVVLCDRPPATAGFWAAFSGAEAREADGSSLRIATTRGAILLQTPDAFDARLGAAARPADVATPLIAALCLAVPDLSALSRRLTAEAVPHHARGPALIVPADAAFGTGLVFVEAA